MNAIPGRYNKRDSTQAGSRAQTPSPLSSVHRRPLPFCREPVGELRWERLAARLLVTPARALPLAQQWEAWLAGSAVGTKKYEKQIEKLTQPRRPVLVETHTCERCQPVCKGGAIQSIDTAPILTSRVRHIEMNISR
jgi:hypothetical protein